MQTTTKAITIIDLPSSQIVEVELTGKLERQDYDAFVPEIEQIIEERGKIRLLVSFNDFHGWTAGALWEDVKFDAKHFSDIERLAIVGEEKWEETMAKFCRPFTTADVRFFYLGQAAEAREWLAADAG